MAPDTQTGLDEIHASQSSQGMRRLRAWLSLAPFRVDPLEPADVAEWLRTTLRAFLADPSAQFEMLRGDRMSERGEIVSGAPLAALRALDQAVTVAYDEGRVDHG